MSDRRTRRAPQATLAPGAETRSAQSADGPPPFLGRWANLYALVLLVLLAVILALLWLTRSFE